MKIFLPQKNSLVVFGSREKSRDFSCVRQGLFDSNRNSFCYAFSEEYKHWTYNALKTRFLLIIHAPRFFLKCALRLTANLSKLFVSGATCVFRKTISVVKDEDSINDFAKNTETINEVLVNFFSMLDRCGSEQLPFTSFNFAIIS